MYCVSVPNETLYVHRNGKSFWCGNCVGRVNSQVFDPAVRQIAPGLLLCHAPQLKRFRDKTGRVSWDIKYRADLDLTGAGWNKWPTADGTYHLATLDGTLNGPTVYQKADMNALFTLGLTPD